MIEIDRVEYIDCYNQATGEKVFSWKAPKERPTLKNSKGQMLNWIMGMIYGLRKDVPGWSLLINTIACGHI